MTKTLIHQYDSERDVTPAVECRNSEKGFVFVHLWLKSNKDKKSDSKEDNTERTICIECKCYWNRDATTGNAATLQSLFSSSPLSVYPCVAAGNGTLPWIIIQNILVSSCFPYILQPHKRQLTCRDDQYPSIVSTRDQKYLFLLTTVNSGYCYALYPITDQSLRKQLLQRSSLLSKPPPSLAETRPISTTCADMDWKKILFDNEEDDALQLSQGDALQPIICTSTTTSNNDNDTSKMTIATQPAKVSTITTSTSSSSTVIEKDDISSLPLSQYCMEWMTHQESFFLNNYPRQSQFLKKLLEAIRKPPQTNSSHPSIDIMYIDQKTLHQYCSQQKDQQHPHLLQTIAIQIMIRLQLLHHFGVSQIPTYFLLDWKTSNPNLSKTKKKKKNLVQKNTRKEEKDDPKVLIKSTILDLFAYIPFLLDPKQISLVALVSWIFKPFVTSSSSTSWILRHVLDHFELDIPNNLDEGQDSQEMVAFDMDSHPKLTTKITTTTITSTAIDSHALAHSESQPISTTFPKSTTNTNKSLNTHNRLSTATVTTTWKKTGKAIPNHFCSNTRPIIQVPSVANYTVSTKVSMAKLQKEVVRESSNSRPATATSFCLTPQHVDFTPLKKGGRLASNLVADAAAAARTKVARKNGLQ